MNGLALTGRDCGLDERAPMCGVPHHAADNYLKRLLARGYKVAICDQVEDPLTAKGLVDRAVVRVLTPGTQTDPEAIAEDAYQYIAAICQIGQGFGIAARISLRSLRDQRDAFKSSRIPSV